MITNDSKIGIFIIDLALFHQGCSKSLLPINSGRRPAYLYTDEAYSINNFSTADTTVIMLHSYVSKY